MAPRTLVLADCQFTSIKRAIQFIEQQPELQQYGYALELYHFFEQRREDEDKDIATIYDYVEGNKLWDGLVSEADFEEQWAQAKATRNRVRSRDSDMAAIKRTLDNNWGEDTVNSFWGLVKSRKMAEHVRTFSNQGRSYENFLSALSRHMFVWIVGIDGRREQGQQKEINITTRDVLQEFAQHP